MSGNIDLARAHRELARWRILFALNVSRPYSTTAEVLWQTVVDLRLPFNLDDVKKELQYLEGKKLVSIENKGTARPWAVELTPDGVDVVEYNVPTPLGIARPPLPGV